VAKVADGVTLTDSGGTNEISDYTDIIPGPTAEVLGAFSVEGTKKEPREGQVWPRLA
jgi:hypothetical protein